MNTGFRRKKLTSVFLASAVFLVLVTFLAACALPAKHKGSSVQRYGSVIGVKKEKIDEYKKLHAAVWPDVLKMIKECNIHNYSIYLRQLPDGNYYLFSYFEYTGMDFKADMARMAADPTTQKWWEVCIPCQQPLADRSEGEWWASMEEVFHYD